MLFILFLLFVLTLFFEYRVKSPFFLFVLVSQSIYILSCTYFNNMYPDWVESEVEYLGFIFFSVYLISRFFIYSVFFNDLKINNEFSVEWLIKPVVYVSGLSLFISLFLFDFDIFSAINSNWADNRSASGVLSLITLYTYYISSSILLVGIIQKNKKIIFFSLFYSIFYVLVFKSRGYLISLFLPILVYFFLFTKISIRKIFLLLFSTFLVAFLYLFTRYLRWIDGVENFDISNFSLHEMLGDDSSELELIGILYKVIYYDEYHYLVSESFLTIKRILFFWVPDFIYEKPRDLSYVLWDYQTGVLGVSGSYHPTIVAEAYFNDKYLGVFIYPIFISVCFSMIDFFVKKDKSFLIYIMGPLCFFITALSRGSSYNAFLVLIISIVFFIFIKRVFGKK